MDIRGAVDAAVPTNIIAAKAAEVRANLVNWQSYLQWVLPTTHMFTGVQFNTAFPQMVSEMFWWNRLV